MGNSASEPDEMYDSDEDIEYTGKGHIAGSYGMFLAGVDYHSKSVEDSNENLDKSFNEISCLTDVLKICRELEEEALTKRRKWYPSQHAS